MIYGLGIDIVENSRIKHLIEKYSFRFLNRVFAEDEINYANKHKNIVPYLAARFAVKEATIKALNFYSHQGISLKDVYIRGRHFGKKNLSFSPQLSALFNKLEITKNHFSISHSKNSSVAVVVLEKL